MQWNDEAIVLSARKFGERDLIVTVFAQNEGIYNGIVKAGQSRAKLPNFQAGNMLEINWRARLSEQLGTITAELKTPTAALLLHDATRLQALLAANSLIKLCLPEREKDYALYKKYFCLINDLIANEKWQRDYVIFELELLKHIGFGLDLAFCAVTGRADSLAFVSPKTGRAVSAAAAIGYENKLLKFPALVVSSDFSGEDINQGLILTSYFLLKEVFLPQNKKLPAERERLAEILQKNSKKFTELQAVQQVSLPQQLLAAVS